MRNKGGCRLTIAPHLSRGFTVIAKAEDVLARFEGSWDFNHITNTESRPVNTLAAGTRRDKLGDPRTLVPRVCGVLNLVAPGAVAAWCLRAWHAGLLQKRSEIRPTPRSMLRRRSGRTNREIAKLVSSAIFIRDTVIRGGCCIVRPGDAAWSECSRRHGHK